MTTADELRREVETFAQREGRRPGTRGHRAAQEYLERRLEELGLRPYRDAFRLPYRAGGIEHANVVAELPGSDETLPPLLVGSHYDSVIEAPCADDNAAAVAINLAVAGALKRVPRSRGIVFAFFDAEEPPFFLGPSMGSIRFYEDQMRSEGVVAAIVMDLVGHAVDSPLEQPDVLFITGAESHRRLPLEIKAARGELPIVAAQNRLVGDLSDHHVFREHDVPYLFLTCGRWEHYHTRGDLPSRLSYPKMTRIAGFLLRLSSRLLEGEWGEPGDGDTTAFELELLHDIGMRDVRTREDIDRLAYALQSRFGI